VFNLKEKEYEKEFDFSHYRIVWHNVRGTGSNSGK
jgi:hypothetical protein